MPEDRMMMELDAITQDYASAEPTPQFSKEHDELIKSIDEQFKRDHEARYVYESDWDFYRQYLKGEQRILRNRDTGEVVKISEDDDKKLRSTFNILRPTARSLVGKMTRAIPAASVTPATADFAEQHGAHVATALLKYARKTQKLDLKYVQLHEYIPWAGNAFIQLHWNRFAGRKIAYCSVCDFNVFDEDMLGQMCPQCEQQRIMETAAQSTETNLRVQQDQQEVMLGVPESQEELVAPMKQMGPLPLDQDPPALEEVREGEVEVLVRDPRYVHPEAGADSIEECQRITVRVPLPVPELRRMLPEVAEYIKAEEEIVVDQTADIRYNNLDGENSSEVLDDHAYYWEIHERPTERYPHGRVIYRVNDMIARILGIDTLSELPIEEQEDNPYYVLNRHPIYQIGFDKNNGEFWFEPFISQAWHRQRELNRHETTMREWAELWVKPRMLIPIGARISADEISSAGEQLISYNAQAGEPKELTVQAWPAQIENRRHQLGMDVQLQASVTEQDMGISPTDPNGRAMAIIEAESDQQLGPIQIRNHSEWREMHRGYLQLFRELAHPETKFSIPGPEGTEAFCFEELVLEDGWDIELEQDDGLSQNKAVRLTQGLDLLAAGVFNDPVTGLPDMKSFLRVVKLNMPSAGYDIERTERSAAAQIPFKIERGVPWQPMLEDDPAIFAEVLIGWLRGPGRRKTFENPMLVEQVRMIWQFYAQWAITGMLPPMGMEMGGMGGPQQGPGPGPGGPDMTSMGGTPNNPGHLGTDLMTQAGQQVGAADRVAEHQARLQPNHEG